MYVCHEFHCVTVIMCNVCHDPGLLIIQCNYLNMSWKPSTPFIRRIISQVRLHKDKNVGKSNYSAQKYYLPCPIVLKCGSFHKRVNDVQVISAGENIMRIVVPVALHAPPRELVAVIHHGLATNHFCICAAL